MTDAAVPERIIKLQTGDDAIVEVRLDIALECEAIANVVRDVANDTLPVELPNVTSWHLLKVLEFVTHYHELPNDQKPAAPPTAEESEQGRLRRPIVLIEYVDQKIFLCV